jgi:hypothetical protein
MANFFQKTFLDEYRNNALIQKMLKGGALLTQSEFVAWYKPVETRSTRHISDHKEDIESENLEIALQFLDEICVNICRKIGPEYAQDALRKTANDLIAGSEKNFDLLVSVTEGYNRDMGKTPKSTKREQNDKNKYVVGFIVVEKGECKLFKQTFCVNLICVKEGTIKGSVLLGAYLYCIKTSTNIKGKNQRGMLELSGSYSNLAGFFSYTKLGFDKDATLIHKKCFNSPENLPMSVDLIKYEPQDIIDLVTGVKVRGDFGDEVVDDTGIFAYGALKNKNDQIIQEKIGRAYAIYEYVKIGKKDPEGDEMIEEKVFLNLITDMSKNDTNDMKLEKIQNYITAQKKRLPKKNCKKSNTDCTISGGTQKKKQRNGTTMKTTTNKRKKWILF